MTAGAVTAAPTAEERILIATQRAIASRPGVLPAARGLSHFGEHSLGWLAIAAIGVAVDRGNRAQWATAGIGAFTAHAASVVLKRVVRRKRPHHDDIAVGVATPSQLSFPSSHATSSTAAAILIGRALSRRALGRRALGRQALDGRSAFHRSALVVPAVVVPPMLASRLVLGVHYPSDVVLGSVLGASVAAAAVAAEGAVLRTGFGAKLNR